MLRVEEAITIGLPVEEVFAYLSDVEHLAEWAAEVQSTTVTETGPVRVGMPFQQTIRIVGRTFEAPMAVTVYDPPRRFEFARTSGPMRARIDFALAPVESGTRVVQTFEGESGGLLRLADSLLAGTMSRQTRANLTTLKTLLESESPVEAVS